jgi:uncharacterized phage-associated protein
MLINCNQEKVVNTIVYLLQNLGGTIYLTKLIKLLYILDECSVKETGVPFTWLEYKAWRKGPVPVELYDLLRNKIGTKAVLDLFSEFLIIDKKDNPLQTDKDAYLISSKHSFNDDEFCEYEINLMDRIIQRYGSKNSNELIEILHSIDSLWYKTVEKHQLDFQFNLMQNRSDFTISFTELIKEDLYLQQAYQSAYQSIKFENELN